MKRFFPVALVLGLALSVAACGGSDKKSVCEAGCEKAAAAKCVNDGTQSQCVTECNAVWDATTCQKEVRAFLTCASKTTFTCDSSGQANPPDSACISESNALQGCLFP